MDEYEGFFRAATTSQRFTFGEPLSTSNNIYILDQEMKIAGRLEGLAPSEKIYSVRYFGPRAYLVTYRQIDPLFTVDLKDPYNPKVLGELKIPGYSDYLHPFDENHLIGIGKELSATQPIPVDETLEKQTLTMPVPPRTAEPYLKIGLFDVSDPSNPTLSQLAVHVRKNCEIEGFCCLRKVNKTAIKRILDEQPVQPHKTNYYLVRKDPEFDTKMAQVLVVYQEVNQFNDDINLYSDHKKATVSYDEKPGIQAIAGIAKDLPPEPGKYKSWGRDYEYRRLGTLSLLAGIDLHDGFILSLIRERHRSLEFTEFLQVLHEHYDPAWQIRVILDNHSAHVSKETMQWLKQYPNRFEFVFTPKHGSWLNMIEMFFSKMTRSFLRSLRVSTKEELKLRINQYLDEVNADPVIFKWKYRLDELTV